ncbi:MAG: hypothetical protein WBZ37_26095, partial [Mycobacterium sp.]
MVGSVTDGSQGPTVVAGAAGVVAVGVGIAFRPAATIAVLFSVTAIVVSNPPPVLAAVAGLCAAAYLVCRYAVGTPTGVVMGNWPTVVAAA